MALRCGVWGFGYLYASIANKLIHLADCGQLEIVSITAGSLPTAGYIDGIPVITKNELSNAELDVLVMCVEDGYNEAVREACEVYGINRDIIVPWRVFTLPRFDIHEYFELERSNVSIISDLCWGGLLYRALGLRCQSPFRDMFIWNDDYLRLLGDLKHYCTEADLQFSRLSTDERGTRYPMMLLGGDVRLHFNHARSPEEAIAEWDKRVGRINWDNLFIEMKADSPESETAFYKLGKFANRVCFVPYESSYENSVYVPPNENGDPFYNRVNASVRLERNTYLLDPIKLLLGKSSFRRYSRWEDSIMEVMPGIEGVPRTSVVIPVYNTEDYLPACLDSVLAQTQRDIEVILIDDGSTDGSLEIEHAYAERDSRVRVLQQPNLKQGNARNRGLAEARGEYVYFMDSDDIIMPELFETCYRICKRSNLDFVTFDSAGFVDDPNVERSELFQEMCDRSSTVTSETIDGPSFWAKYFIKGMTPFVCWLEYFDRSFLLENDLQFVEGIYFEDNDWIARVYMTAQRMQYAPLKLHRYRERPGSNVHAGFTPVLADSCFDVHRILCELACEQTDPSRLRVLQDVSTVKDIRFRQFSELEPSDSLRTRAIESAAAMREGCLDRLLPNEVRIMHLMSLLNLARGVRSWPGTPIPISRELVITTLFDEFPDEQNAMRLGVYGTGKVCQALLNVLDCSRRTCVYLESKVESGQLFKGQPVYSIDDAGQLDLDVLIIASTKYVQEMKEKAVQVLGEDMPMLTVPRAVLYIDDLKLTDGL